MKKIIVLFLCFMGAMLVNSCSSSPKSSSKKSTFVAKTPGEVGLQDAKYLFFGDIDNFIDCISNKDFDRSSSSYKQDREKLEGILKDKLSIVIGFKGKITDLQLDSEQIKPDGKHAIIKLKTEFDGKRVEITDISMIKEKGKWMVDLSGWK